MFAESNQVKCVIVLSVSYGSYILYSVQCIALYSYFNDSKLFVSENVLEDFITKVNSVNFVGSVYGCLQLFSCPFVVSLFVYPYK